MWEYIDRGDLRRPSTKTH
ncbi:hypothetical protein Taro_030062 [Colocasia esculenta]|uniref:Uncharacterized protein n=1 Tax=Colocasia esculenta TaxID=4460 RepID=A0A843VWS6_COLES|nr:hypothetical protein [Colocasia esculenta]